MTTFWQHPPIWKMTISSLSKTYVLFLSHQNIRNAINHGKHKEMVIQRESRTRSDPSEGMKMLAFLLQWLLFSDVPCGSWPMSPWSPLNSAATDMWCKYQMTDVTLICITRTRLSGCFTSKVAVLVLHYPQLLNFWCCILLGWKKPLPNRESLG
jgi:hypothetical protein